MNYTKGKTRMSQNEVSNTFS